MSELRCSYSHTTTPKGRKQRLAARHGRVLTPCPPKEPQPRSQERRALELARTIESGGPDRVKAARELAALGPAGALCAERVAARIDDADPDARAPGALPY